MFFYEYPILNRVNFIIFIFEAKFVIMKSLNSVLLVDDDPVTNFINERLIKKLNITTKVAVALNGLEGLEYLRSNCNGDKSSCPELILLDINMPVMDGFEFLEKFKELKIDCKDIIIVAMLTTSSNLNDIKKVESLGEKSYLNKPLTKENLEDLLKKYFS